MAPNALEAARSRYAAAYETYQQAAARVAQKLSGGLIPSAAEVEDEAQATVRLSAARRKLLDVMTSLAPPKR
jgi:hypothetical protein